MLDQLEQRKRFIVIAVGLICALTLLVTAMREPSSYDAFWQMQMGKDWIENGLSPWIDHYSFTFPGADIVSPPVLFQATLYKLVDIFGEYGGFFTIKLSAFFLVLALMLLWLRTIRAPALAYCLVLPLLTFLIQLRAIVRPELFSYSLSVLALLLCRRSKLELSFKAMWPIVLLLLFWTNYHSSILAYVIFFGLFVEIALRLIRENAALASWGAWAGWGLVLVGVGFINPDLNHAVLQTMAFPSEWKMLIQEYEAATLYRAVPAVYALLAVSVVTILLLFRQGKLGYLSIVLVFVYSGLTMARMVTPGGIVILCLFALGLADARLTNRIREAPAWAARTVILLALIIFTVPMLNSLKLARDYLQENRRTAGLFPEKLVDHMVSNLEPGRIFNSYELGGYLVHRLPREYPNYIDGRTGILYPLEHYKKLLEAKAFTATFTAEVEKYGIDYALLESTAGIAGLMAASGFELEFSDSSYALYVRGEGSLARSGTFWARPYCWQASSARTLGEEWIPSKQLISADAPLLQLLILAGEYAKASDPPAFVKNTASGSHLNDASRRFLAYRAMETGDYGLALGLFNLVARREVKDYLAAALAHLRLDQPSEAEQVIDQAVRIVWGRLEFTDLQIQQALLHEISRMKPLERFDAEYVAEMERQVGDQGLSRDGRQVAVADFCPL